MFLARTPHGHHDTAAMVLQLRVARFRKAAVETLTRQSKSPNGVWVAWGTCQGTPLRNEIEAHGTGALAAAIDIAAAAITAQYGTGSVTGRVRAHVITATR